MGILVSKEGDMKLPLFKLGMDIFFYICLVIPIGIFNLTDIVQPNIRGFFCSDISIRYPYRKSTVPSLTLFLIGIPCVAAGTCIIELFHYRRCRNVKRGIFHPIIVALYRVCGYFMVGATLNQILTDVTKLTVGRLRPMFLDVCLPSVTCNSSIEYEYIIDYDCVRTSYPGNTEKEFEEMQMDIRKSFPSGHASFSMYCAVFAVVYLQLRLKYKPVRMFTICLQALLISAAVWTCCTRYIDNKHHPTDIIIGALFGTFIGMFAVYHYYRSLTCTDRKRLPLSNSVSPTSVANKSATPSLQMEREHNGIRNEHEVIVKIETQEDSSHM